MSCLVVFWLIIVELQVQQQSGLLDLCGENVLYSLECLSGELVCMQACLQGGNTVVMHLFHDYHTVFLCFDAQYVIIHCVLLFYM